MQQIKVAKPGNIIYLSNNKFITFLKYFGSQKCVTIHKMSKDLCKSTRNNSANSTRALHELVFMKGAVSVQRANIHSC